MDSSSTTLQLVVIIFTTLCVGSHFGRSTCPERSEMQSCWNQHQELLKGTVQDGLPTKPSEINRTCMAFEKGMICVNKFADSCLNSTEREFVKKHISGATSMFKVLCNDTNFRSAYLKETTCLRGIMPEVSKCAGDFSNVVKDLVKEKTGRESWIADLCCLRKGLIKCVNSVSQLRCKPTAAEMVTRIAETLLAEHVPEEKCSHLDIATCDAFIVLPNSIVFLAILVLTFVWNTVRAS